jgi:glycosyltransferase involved in cell wall biosynthesis
MHKKLTIVHLVPSLGVGGAERVILELCRNVNATRFDSIVTYWHDLQPLLEESSYRETRTVRLTLPRVVSVASVLIIARTLRACNADLLQTHLIDADLIGFFASKLAGVPHIMTIHSYPFPRKRSHMTRYRLYAPWVRRIVCVSETVKKHVCSGVGIGAGKMAVVHNGIDLSRFVPGTDQRAKAEFRASLGIAPGAVVVGNVSRLIKDKGHEHLLAAAAPVMEKHPDVVLLIVGEGELRTELQNLAQALGIGGRVVWTGSRPDIPQLLDIMDLFVFPTYHEAFGICVLEAMAMGKPIIATNDAGVPELLQAGEEGILIRPGDVPALESSMRALLDDPARARALSTAAALRVKRFSLQAMARSMERVYLEALGLLDAPSPDSNAGEPGP